MVPFRRFLDAHSRAVNVVASVLLSSLDLLCIALILTLFLNPSALLLESLITPTAKGIKPTTTVTLITALFVGATSALITRLVEQSLWLKLAPGNVDRTLTVGESRRLAQWSVSPLGRLLYVFGGSHISIKAAGIMIFAISAVSPVLVSGISQAPLLNTAVSSTPHQGDMWNGWLDVANSAYNGGNFADVPGVIGALASLSNLSAPASPVCSSSKCSATAVASSLRATCKSGSQLYGDPVRDYVNSTYASSYNPTINVVLAGVSTYANFSGGYAPTCESVGEVCTPGEWSVIFGAFINATDTATGPWYVNIVDCLVTFGTVEITQNGGNTPVIEDNTFKQNTSAGNFPPSLVPLHRIYTEENGYACPYYFNAGTGGAADGSDSIYNSPLATLLLHPQANSSADEVAQRIENIFMMSTLLAFSRSYSSSDLTITEESAVPLYRYDPKVLSILIIPLVAVLLGTWGHWHIAAKEQIVGYDPIEMARRGPVSGFPDQTEKAYVDQDEIDKMHVWSVEDTTLAEDGSSHVKRKLVVGR